MATDIWSDLAKKYNYANVEDYMNSTGNNWFGLSKAKNPFSRGNLYGPKGATTMNILNQGISALGTIANKGVTNTAGNILTTAGGGLTALLPGPYKAIGLGVTALGQVANGFTDRVNTGFQKAKNAEISNLANFTSRATDYNGLTDEMRSFQNVDLGSLSDWGNIGFLSSGSKVKGARNNAANALATAGGMRIGNINERGKAINMGNTYGQLGHITALGGYLGDIDPSTAIGYSLYTDKYVRDMNKGKGISNMFSGVPNGLFAFGGNLQTNGSTWSDGLIHIGTGGTHEQNPYEGVQVGADRQGVPNLVEEDEVIYDDYVFSNRLRVPRGRRGRYGKRNKYAKGGKLDVGSISINDYQDKVLKPYLGMTFADAATKAEKISGVLDRPNDPIATRGFRSILEVLATLQEKEREKEKLAELQQAIDQMSPEELAAFQQQAQEQQAQEQQAQEQQMMAQQQMAVQQQAQYPQEQYPQEEQAYMQQQGIPEEEQYAMAALGGQLYGLGGEKKPKWKMIPSKVIGGRPKLISYEEYERKYNADGTPKQEFHGFGEGKFGGSGRGGRFKLTHVDKSDYEYFNDAYDAAVRDNAETFTWGNRVYNTRKENNPVREVNNRDVGGRRKVTSVENLPPNVYPKEDGPIRSILNAYPIVTETYDPNKETIRALGGHIYGIGEMLDTQNVYPNMFATGGVADRDPEWYNSLTPEQKWIVDTYGITDADQLADLRAAYITGLENIYNTSNNLPTDTSLSGIGSNTYIDQDIYNIMKAFNLTEKPFNQITPQQWQEVYKEYQRQAEEFEKAHPTIPFSERFKSGYVELWQQPEEPYTQTTDKNLIKEVAQDVAPQIMSNIVLDDDLKEVAKTDPNQAIYAQQSRNAKARRAAYDAYLPEGKVIESVDYTKPTPQIEAPEQITPSPKDKSVLTKILAYNNIDEKTWTKKSPKARHRLADKYEKSLKTQEEKNQFNKDYDLFVMEAFPSINEGTYEYDISPEAIDAERKQIQAQREVDRLYRKRGQDPKTLTGSAAALHDEDVKKVQEDPSLLKKDPQKKLAANKIGKRSPETFNAKAETIVVNNARDAFLTERPLNENGRLNIKYNDEGTIPQGLTFVKNRISYNDKTKQWEDAQGNRIDNPYTSEYGFNDVARDWSKYGYLNPNDNSWTDVEYNPPITASGNTDYMYTPWNEWFKQSGMDADQYESQEAYLNNYLDFLDDIYNEDSPNHQAALKRLYEMGEASKSNAPGELKGKNRYFDVDEGFDINNLSLDNLRLIDGNNTIGGSKITGYSKYNKKANEVSSNKQYYVNKDGTLMSSDKYEELDESSKKNWTPLNHKGLTREDVLGHLKTVRNSDYAREPQDLLYNSMFDNVPAQSYLMAPKSTKRYVQVDKQGNFLRDANNNIREINFDPNATYQYYNEGKPLEGQSQFIDGVNIDTIGILGGNVENHIGVRRNPDGTWRTFDLSPKDVEKVKQREILSNDERYKTLPQFEKAVEGYTFTPHYYELDDDAYKSLGFDAKGHKIDEVIGEDGPPFPKMPTWPYWTALGLQGAATLYNALRPIDYSNADALIAASKEAGNFHPIQAKYAGQELPYKPAPDTLFGKLAGQTLSANRSIVNNSRGNIGAIAAGLIGNTYAGNLAQGEADQKWRQGNWGMLKDVQTFGLTRDAGNYDRDLKANMSNQDAEAKAAGYKLEGQKAAYAMRQALEDDRSKAVSAGISGIGSALMAMADTKYKNDLLGWSTYHNSYGPMSGYEGRWTRTPPYHTAYGGKLKKRRRRGLDF